MNKMEKFLMPTEFSPCSQEAIDYAISLAERLNTTILLTHILEPISYPLNLGIIEPADDDPIKAVQALDRIAHPLQQKGIKIETHFFKGNPVSEIVRKAKELECDLIVMGTHGRIGIAHFMIGSVAERVVRTAPIPVLTVQQRKGKEPEKIFQAERALEIFRFQQTTYFP